MVHILITFGDCYRKIAKPARYKDLLAKARKEFPNMSAAACLVVMYYPKLTSETVDGVKMVELDETTYGAVKDGEVLFFNYHPSDVEYMFARSEYTQGNKVDAELQGALQDVTGAVAEPSANGTRKRFCASVKRILHTVAPCTNNEGANAACAPSSNQQTVCPEQQFNYGIPNGQSFMKLAKPGATGPTYLVPLDVREREVLDKQAKQCKLQSRLKTVKEIEEKRAMPTEAADSLLEELKAEDQASGTNKANNGQANDNQTTDNPGGPPGSEAADNAWYAPNQVVTKTPTGNKAAHWTQD